MMELSKRIEELLEKHDFSLCGEITEAYGKNNMYKVVLETWSPLGENVIVSLTYDGTDEGFIHKFVNYANNFDSEEHAEEYVGYRGTNGVPDSIKDLLEDAECIKETLMGIADELNNLDRETEDLNNMSREQFYNYIMENFNISGETARLINNILHFVEENYTEENEQYKVLCDLLDGTIGLSDAEIRKVYM